MKSPVPVPLTRSIRPRISIRRRLENALQAAVDALSRGSREETVRSSARRLARALDRIDDKAA
jgi:hypothetical protein